MEAETGMSVISRGGEGGQENEEDKKRGQEKQEEKGAGNVKRWKGV